MSEQPNPQPKKWKQSGQIIRIDPIGRAIDNLVAMYDRGEILGQVTVALTNHGDFIVIYDSQISYIEKLGLIEAAKTDIIGKALEVLP